MASDQHPAAAASEHQPAPAPVRSQRYFNRELSWLAFNERVLDEAANTQHPLLERLRFLSISGSNLDEFFMVRVAGLKGHAAQGVESLSDDGLSAGQQIAAIAERSDRLIQSQRRILLELEGELQAAGLDVLDPVELEALVPADADWLREHFRLQLLPVLTPQALDPSHPFPFLPNGGLSVLFDLRRQADGSTIRELVMVPQGLPRFLRLPGEPARFVPMETLLRVHSGVLFPGYDVRGSGAFRILRDGDIEIEEEAEDLVQHFRSAIKRRRRGRVTRLEIEQRMPAELTRLLLDELGNDDADVSEVPGFLGMADLAELVDEDRPDLKFAPFAARFPERIRDYDGDCFAAIRAKDIVVQHPYESFDVVLAFLRQAAADPDVVAIKQTLYRAGKQSAVVRALIDAAEAGKSVTAVVELKARFDEEQNLVWAAALERAGVQVVYGFQEWKTHAKISMVVRREGSDLATYCHFGTGNYHPVTARLYTDLSFFTADDEIARDATQIFNYITGYIDPPSLTKLTMSPLVLAVAAHPVDRRRDRVGEGGADRRHLGEDEFVGRSGHHRKTLRGERGGRADRAGRPRHLLPPSPGRRAVRHHSRQVRRRAFPGTLPHLGVRARCRAAERRRGRVHLIGRLDASQPRPSRRVHAAHRECDGARPGAGPGDARQSAGHPAKLVA